MKKILVLYAGVGHGHLKIAENISAALRQDPDNEVDAVNLFEVESQSKLLKWGAKIYIGILEYWPALWGFFYNNPIFLKLTLPLRRPIAGLKAGKTWELLKSNHYDIIVSTEINVSAIVSFLKDRSFYKGKFVVSFSDFHLHPYWLFDNVDLYLANVQEQKDEMIAMGVPEDKIVVCGITLQRPKEINQQEVRQKLGLASDDKMLLVLGGGLGLGIDVRMIAEIKDLPAKIFIVCGRNEELKKELEEHFGAQQNIKIFGYLDNLSELYSAATIIVTKPGGLTIAEVLQYRVPIIISSFIPGQEQLNYDYLIDKDLVMPEIVDIRGPIEDELKTGSFEQEIKRNPNIEPIVSYGAEVKEAIAKL